MNNPDQLIDPKTVGRNVDREAPTVIFFSQMMAFFLFKDLIIHGLSPKSMGMNQVQNDLV